MPQPIILAAEDVTTFQTFGPFDSRGVGSLGLEAIVTDQDVNDSDNLAVFVLTRTAGLPWRFAPITVLVNNPVPITWDFNVTLQALGSLNSGQTVPLAVSLGCIRILDETVVVAQPFNFGVSAPAELAVGSLTLTTYVLGDWGNSLQLEYVDPGASNSPLGLSSPDGWTTQVLCETDNMGAIVTTPGDIDPMLNPSTYGTIFTYQIVNSVSPDPVVEMPATPFANGVGGPTQPMSFTITGSY